MKREFTEDTLVQQTTAEYLRDQLDWESIYACNNKTIASAVAVVRGSPRNLPLLRLMNGEVAV